MDPHGTRLGQPGAWPNGQPPSNQPAVSQSSNGRGAGAPVSQPPNGTLSVPVIAEDSDIIEDEWVNSVEQALDDYKSDPWALSNAIATLRADYLKQRYGKDLKNP